jgi:metal-responsive CopG/Arc/MetJ family transcriptional regulator
MGAKPVQVSLDTDLLERIDRDPETRALGRSAFVRRAVERYLAAKERRDLEAQIAAAYRGNADAMLAEIEALIEEQEWPAE